MNYQRHYNTLIERAKNRIIEGYIEEHHIIPVCMNGTNDPTNLVKLTPEEHFVAHQLLVKLYPGVSGLIYGVRMMCFGEKRNNKWYGWLRKKYSEERANFRHTEETKKKMSISRGIEGRRFGPHNEDTRHKISTSVSLTMTEERKQKHSNIMSGRKLSDEHKNKIREKSRLKTNSEETRKKISISNKGKIISEEQRIKMSLAQKGKEYPKVICPHCGKIGAGPNMKRYHFNKCKEND